MLLSVFWIIMSIVALIAGAEFLVRGAASTAKKLGISSLVIGLTVVAFGTSAPELIVNIFSAIKGTTDIAIGNIIGSNIANILLILGVSATIYPLSVKKNTTWKEIPFALMAMIVVFIIGNDMLFDGATKNVITRTDGIILLFFFIIFMYYTFGISKSEGENETIKILSWPISFLLLAGGLIMLFIGGHVLVDNAIILARIAGLSETFIGLTIVAVGTSLPELATSVVAVIHKHDDIAIGNVIGSNIFNVFWILGLTSVIRPLPFSASANFDVLFGVFASLLLFIFMFVHTQHKINRWQGILFVGLYVLYILYLINRG